MEAGQIVNTHGIQGEVRIQPWADDAAFLTRFHRFFLDGSEIKVRSCRVHKSMCIASLEGIENINDAMPLKGKVIFINRDDAQLPNGTMFLQDMLGCQVQDETGRDLGVVEEILSEPASSVLVVRGEREILIPDVSAFILKKDPDAGMITVRLIDGM